MPSDRVAPERGFGYVAAGLNARRGRPAARGEVRRVVLPHHVFALQPRYLRELRVGLQG